MPQDPTLNSHSHWSILVTYLLLVQQQERYQLSVKLRTLETSRLQLR